ncbi:MAG: glutamate racemase [Lachnospiraceae bacterium]|nr:glutamate racemase [Lachnospiraceae bacterium]MBP3611481.1 glutamate racemase [Lachnospiraceae bacterium]
MKQDAPIGVFDSGVGGLTVVKEIMNALPAESIVYYGDTARVPYGNKSAETITAYSRQIAKFLMTQDVKAIVVACNTISALALETIKAEFEVPFIGVVKPGAKMAAKATQNKRIGIIATEGTISSGIYEKFLKATSPEVEVFGKACPLFVHLAEEGWLNDAVTRQVAERYLAGLKEKQVDTLVLGCTHYPLLRGVIGEVMGEGVTLVNPAYETARELIYVLEEAHLLRNQETVQTPPAHKFYVSDGAEKFRQFANTILPCDHLEVEDVAVKCFE